MTLGDLNVVIGIASFIVAVIGTAFGMWRWMATALRANQIEFLAEISKVYTLIDTRSNEMDGKIGRVRDQHNAFELEVAKYYASDDRLHELEVKFTASIDKLINRFDAFATEFHKILGRMERRSGGDEA